MIINLGIVGKSKNANECDYRAQVSDFVSWYDINWLISMLKRWKKWRFTFTVKITLKKKNTSNEEITIMQQYKYFGVIIDEK